MSKFKVGDIVQIRRDCPAGERFKYGPGNQFLILGDRFSPETTMDQKMVVTAAPDDGTIECDDNHWYANEWTEYASYITAGQSAFVKDMTLEEKINNIDKNVKIIMEILGVVEDAN